MRAIVADESVRRGLRVAGRVLLAGAGGFALVRLGHHFRRGLVLLGVAVASEILLGGRPRRDRALAIGPAAPRVPDAVRVAVHGARRLARRLAR